jgi:hypothetical protein
MRKVIIDLKSENTVQRSKSSAMEHIASVGVTSEAPGFSIESALGLADGPGWRADHASEQLIRIVFDEPHDIRRVELKFHEADRERTQEFVLSWAAHEDQAVSEVRRQRWNFSPGGSTIETEDYSLHLEGARILELRIDPDLSRKEGVASLVHYRIS